MVIVVPPKERKEGEPPPTEERAKPQGEYAHFGLRLASASMDAAIVFVFAAIVYVFLLAAMGEAIAAFFGYSGDGSLTILFLQIPIVTIVILSIPFYLMMKKWQNSPGKAIGKIIVIDVETGGKPSNRRLIIRLTLCIAVVVCFVHGYVFTHNAIPRVLFMLVVVADFLRILFDSEKRLAFHDLLSGTAVIRRTE